VCEPPTAEEVAELRARLYRPDPPDDAVDAYLQALDRTRVALAPAPGPAPHRHAYRSARIAVVASGVVAAASVVVGALAAGADVEPFALPTPAAARVAIPEAVDGYPPVAGERLGGLSGTGLGVGRFDAGGRTAIVSVWCTGGGTLSLQISADPPVVLTCQKGSGPALAMVPSAGPLDRFSVWVARSGPVRWTASVGALS
jgi:hypothetical protein